MNNENDDVSLVVGGLIIIAFICFMAMAINGYFANRINIDDAMARFEQMSRSDVHLIRHSNNSILFGDPHDVTFELRINASHVTGRCTSAEFSQMVCRLYTVE